MDARLKRLLLRVGIMTALAMGAYSLLWFGMGRMTADGCENRVVQEIASPDRQLKAVVFRRDCGAAKGVSTQVSLLPADQWITRKPGNLFSVDALPSHVKINLRWTGSRQLTLDCRGDWRIMKAVPLIQGVTVTYQVPGLQVQPAAD